LCHCDSPYDFSPRIVQLSAKSLSARYPEAAENYKAYHLIMRRIPPECPELTDIRLRQEPDDEEDEEEDGGAGEGDEDDDGDDDGYSE
jgi:hypothetical protein